MWLLYKPLSKNKVVPRLDRPLDVWSLFLKEDFMRRLILCGVLFIVIFCLRFLVHINLNSKKKSKKKKDLNEIGTPIEILYLIKRFGLVPSKLKSKKIGALISLIDAFILTTTIYVASLVSDKILLEILVGTILVFILIFGINEIFGNYLKRKGYDKK